MIRQLLAYSLLCAPLLAKPLPPTEKPAPRHEKPVGVGNYGEETIDSMKGEGLVKLNGTNVTALQVSGSLVSKDAKLGSLTILGEANLRDTTIAEESDIIGFLQTHSSHFQKALSISSQKAIFTRTKIQSLTVRKEPSYKGKQVIELKQGSIVYGPIHFESGKGEIQLDASSRIEGKVTGGKVIRRNS
jgi:hypothetical protein